MIQFLLASHKTLVRPLYRFTSAIPTNASEVQGKGFYMQQLFTGCLAEYAYYIESDSQAAIIDPLRDVDVYLDLAKSRGATIKYIFLSHFHADFVAGHLPLQQKTGAKIIMGPNADAPYVSQILKDKEFIQLGQASVQLLHTPGHTLESSCFLLHDADGKKHSIYTGDTLFLGEVGRPDLAVKSDLSKDDLAALLYESIQKHILTQPNDLIVYPGHGAGSSCGKKISSGFNCTIGNQKQKNYALQPMSKQDFIKSVAGDLPEPPKYFFYNASLNRKGDLKSQTDLKPLKANEVQKYLKEGARVIDSRNDALEYLPNSLNLPLKLQLAAFLGLIEDHNQNFIILADKGEEVMTKLRMSRIGYDNVIGYVEGGIESWKEHGFEVVRNSGQDGQDFLKTEGQLIDVRNPEECQAGMLKGAKMIPVGKLNKQLNEMDKKQKVRLYCAGGNRAKIGASLLQSLGYDVTYSRQGYETLNSLQ